MDEKKKHSSRKAWFIAIGIFLFFVILTVFVWKQQVDYQRSLLWRHTDDVRLQASRRLQVFVESHLRVASIFAKRWSTHESRDFSRQRFEEFASVLIKELPGYYAIALLPADSETRWIIPKSGLSTDWELKHKRAGLLEEARKLGHVVLSEPTPSENGETAFFAVLPLMRETTLLGYLIVDFHADTLFNDCFHTRIKSEFHFRVDDGGHVLFVSDPAARKAEFFNSTPQASMEFPVSNRTWRLTMVPRNKWTASSSWTANISVPLLGLFLSVALSYLGFLLVRRVEMYRHARDKALNEVEERQKAEAALLASETRYRSVFDSATDGLLVFHPDGCIVEANPAAQAICGYRPDEIMGRPIEDLISPEHRHRFDTFRRQLIQKNTAGIDSIALLSNGSRVDVEVRGTRLKQTDHPRLLAIITDISERKRAMIRHAQLSRKVIVAQEEERTRLSVELHDELGQLLTALRLELGWLQKQIPEDADEKKSVFENTIIIAERASEELRRICKGLRPPLLDDLGIGPAARLLVDEFRAQTGIDVDLRIQTEDRKLVMPEEIALCAYRILQESLTNIRKHSQAKNVVCELSTQAEKLTLAVSDDGIGFDRKELGALQGCGLEGMVERANLADGTIEIQSMPQKGTQISLWVPIHSANLGGKT